MNDQIAIQMDSLAVQQLGFQIATNFAAIRALKDTNRSAEFIYELVYAIEDCKVVAEVYLNNNNVLHPNYALEKLRHAIRVLENICEYYKEQEIKTK